MFARIVAAIVVGFLAFYGLLTIVVAAYHGFVGPAWWTYFMTLSVCVSGYLIEYGKPNRKVATKRLKIAILTNISLASILAAVFVLIHN